VGNALLSSRGGLPNGKVNSLPSKEGVADTAVGSEDEEEDAFSEFSFSCFSLEKYHSEANSVMCRGSISLAVDYYLLVAF